MTPKEKSDELFKKYYCMNNNSKSKIKVINFETAKQCALITVDEILLTDPIQSSGESDSGIEYKSNDSYWQEVKDEIEKL